LIKIVSPKVLSVLKDFLRYVVWFNESHIYFYVLNFSTEICGLIPRMLAKKVFDISGSKMVDKKLPAVPESILKRRKRQAESRAARAKAAATDKVNRHKKRIEIFKRAEKYVKEYRDKEQEEIQLHREAKKDGNYYVAGDPKLAFVMRIRGINQVAPKVRKVLQLFRLRQINNGVFIKLNKATINMLRICGEFKFFLIAIKCIFSPRCTYVKSEFSINRT